VKIRKKKFNPERACFTPACSADRQSDKESKATKYDFQYFLCELCVKILRPAYLLKSG